MCSALGKAVVLCDCCPYIITEVKSTRLPGQLRHSVVAAFPVSFETELELAPSKQLSMLVYLS